jgi:hypothetical protein
MAFKIPNPYVGLQHNLHKSASTRRTEHLPANALTPGNKQLDAALFKIPNKGSVVIKSRLLINELILCKADFMQGGSMGSTVIPDSRRRVSCAKVIAIS